MKTTRCLRQETAEFMAYGGNAREQLEGLFRFTRHQYCNGRPVCMVGVLSVEIDELSEEAREAIQSFMMDSTNWLTKVLETGREAGDFRFDGCAKSKAFSILAMIQGARQLARMNGKDLLDITFRQVRTDLGIES